MNTNYNVNAGNTQNMEIDPFTGRPGIPQGITYQRQAFEAAPKQDAQQQPVFQQQPIQQSQPVQQMRKPMPITQPPQKRDTYSLYSMDISSWVETKPGGKGKTLSYLSWAAAWHIVKRYFPDAKYEPIRDQEGRIYWSSPAGYVVGVKLTLNGGEEYEEWLPVMDAGNNAMKETAYTYSTQYGDKSVEAADMRDVNDALKRCLVKVIATATGLGLCLWVPQGLPAI